MKLFNYKIDPKNRQERRKVEKEIKRALPVFIQIEQDLIRDIFNEEDECYNDIYTRYLETWNKTIDEWIRLKRFKFVYVNRFYLEETYKPIEHENI